MTSSQPARGRPSKWQRKNGLDLFTRAFALAQLIFVPTKFDWLILPRGLALRMTLWGLGCALDKENRGLYKIRIYVDRSLLGIGNIDVL